MIYNSTLPRNAYLFQSRVDHGQPVLTVNSDEIIKNKPGINTQGSGKLRGV